MNRNAVKSFALGVVAGGFVFALVMIVTNYFGIHLFAGSSLSDDIGKRAKVVESYIDKYYWKDDTSDKKISEYAAKGMVAALGDKYSVYYTSEELKDSMDNIAGDYAGIGATLQADAKTGQKTITEVQSGKPADKAGICVGDVVIKVNGKSTKEMSLSELVGQIKGEEGIRSVLTISREENGETITKDITVVSEKIVKKTVTGKMLESNVGYIGISEFDKETVNQFEKALTNLDQQGQKGLIIDLRNNGGGSLTAVISMLDRMLPKGKLITEKNKAKGDRVYSSTDDKCFQKPVVIVMNENSASASEVFAGCMQDRKAASLVGTKSFGKGIVQTIFSLEKSCGGGIKLTTGEYLLPSGRCIQGEGLTPDVEVKYTGSTKEFCATDDNQLSKAVEVMKEKLQ